MWEEGFWDVGRGILGCGKGDFGMWEEGFWDVEKRILGCGKGILGLVKAEEIDGKMNL
jgi:hypothetical protein